MNIAICESNENDTQHLNALLLDALRRLKIDQSTVSIDYFSAGEELLTCNTEFDLVFITNQLPGISGLDTAKQLKTDIRHPFIVLTADNADYCLESYDIGIEAYLLKPITPARFSRACDHLIPWLNPSPRTLDIFSNRLLYQIPVRKIMYIESFGRKCLIHTQTTTYETNLALTEIQETLNDTDFIRCYRSFLVNMRYISSFGEMDILLNNGEKIPLTLRKHNYLIQQYNQFQNRISDN